MAAITVNDSEKFNRKSQSITITQNGYPDRSQYMIQTTLCVVSLISSSITTCNQRSKARISQYEDIILTLERNAIFCLSFKKQLD